VRERGERERESERGRERKRKVGNGVATISRLLKITGLFFKKHHIKETIFCKRDL